MTPRELIEMAMLDSLGILDSDEQISFEQAFAAATPAVQDRVRAEQELMTDIEHLLPEDAPRPELREIVLAAVRAAMGSELAPVVATISPERPDQAVRVTQPKISTAKRVNRAWRTATIGLIAAAVAMGAFIMQAQQIYNEAQQRMVVNRLYDNLGADIVEDLLFDGRTRSVAFMAAEGVETGASAAVWQNPDWTYGRLFLKNLPTNSGEQLRLVVLDESGQVVRQVAEFTGSGRLEDIEVTVSIADSSRLAITRHGKDTPAGGEVLMVTSDQI